MVVTRRSQRLAAVAPVQTSAKIDAKPAVTKAKKKIAPSKVKAVKKLAGSEIDVKAVKTVAGGIDAAPAAVVKKEAKKGTAGSFTVAVEHCKSCQVYRRKASAVVDALRQGFPDSDISVEINSSKPRSKSFEITLKTEDKEEVVWSGIKRGPPRKLKFPEPSEIVTAVKTYL